jgi:hypothetical protein
MDNKGQIVHINRLKAAYNVDALRPKPQQKRPKKHVKENMTQKRREEEKEMKIGSIPTLRVRPAEALIEHGTPTVPVLDTPEMGRQQAYIPYSERRDPSYEPPETPRSRSELKTLRSDPPFTRSQARLQAQDLPVETQDGQDH